MNSIMCHTWVVIPITNEQGQIIENRPIRYDMFVLKLFKQIEDYKMLSHAGRGICTEAGEINDCIKKCLDYDQDLNIENLVEELGDMRFYMQAIQNMYGITEKVILQANATKLSIRYKNLTYSDEEAKLRRDKDEK